jgi:hypothetical protein
MAKRKSKKAEKEEVVVQAKLSVEPSTKKTTVLPLKSAKDIADLKERIQTLERLVQSVLDRVAGN